MDEAGVEFAGVSYAYGAGEPLLRGISLKLEPGTTTALLGRSGSGKTTLMRMVNGLVMPTGGSVRVAGRATTEWDLLGLRRSIGYVIQESGLFPHMTISENVGLPLGLSGQGRAGLKSGTDEYGDRVEAALKKVGLELREFGARYPWLLSGGQRQRVGVARALVNEPGILLMDEPFGALDPMTRAEMQRMIRELLKEERKTVLLVTHDLAEALFLADRVVFLDRGAVAADLRPNEVEGSEIEYVRTYVAATNPRRDGNAA